MEVFVFVLSWCGDLQKVESIREEVTRLLVYGLAHKES